MLPLPLKLIDLRPAAHSMWLTVTPASVSRSTTQWVCNVFHKVEPVQSACWVYFSLVNVGRETALLTDPSWFWEWWLAGVSDLRPRNNPCKLLSPTYIHIFWSACHLPTDSMKSQSRYWRYLLMESAMRNEAHQRHTHQTWWPMTHLNVKKGNCILVNPVTSITKAALRIRAVGV